jgi:hypothetical protein
MAAKQTGIENRGDSPFLYRNEWLSLLLWSPPGHKVLNDGLTLWPEIFYPFVGTAFTQFIMWVLRNSHHMTHNHILKTRSGPVGMPLKTK